MISYIDKLQRANADDLAFYPLTTLEKALEAQQIMVAYQNAEPCGYLWHGAIRPGYAITIYQACIDYDARRRLHGWKLVQDLIALGVAGGANAVRLKCASSAESNEFWKLIGGCAACGAGVKYRVVTSHAPKRKKPHIKHEWFAIGDTFENGSKQRKDGCAKCPETRYVDLGGG